MNKPILVTEPFLPELSEFIPYLEKIWHAKVLTNGGPMHRQLEQALCEYLGVPFVSLFNNGTVALMVALRALELRGEVITTPYSFVATANAIVWSGLTPVFVDIDPQTCNLDPARLAEAINPRTCAVLPVHCYGLPCAVDDIQRQAEAAGLAVVYDSAHAFGVRYRGTSLLTHGELSVLSFHATKVFNTFEGGAIISHSAEMKLKIDRLKNFGFENETTVSAAGVNGKMSEVNAAFGLVQLGHMGRVLQKRRDVDSRYRQGLAEVRGIRCLPLIDGTDGNASYFPVFVDAEYPLSRDGLYEKLKTHGIFGRRYFFPLISEFPMYRDLPSASPARLPAAHAVAEHVLCLPIHAGLESADVERVIAAVAAD